VRKPDAGITLGLRPIRHSGLLVTNHPIKEEVKKDPFRGRKRNQRGGKTGTDRKKNPNKAPTEHEKSAALPIVAEKRGTENDLTKKKRASRADGTEKKHRLQKSSYNQQRILLRKVPASATDIMEHSASQGDKPRASQPPDRRR